jgi:hypothetical protein
MRIVLFSLAVIACGIVMSMYMELGNATVSGIWGITTGIWAANLIHALMED